MLVLTRRVGDVIWIGDDIKLTLLDVRQGSIRLGIDAPPAIRVERDERLTDTESAERERAIKGHR